MLNRCRTLISICTMAVAIAGSVRVASAQAQVYVGYADGLRGTPNFPSIWFGDASVGSFNGIHDPAADAGAIMIRNNTLTAFSIDAFSVQIGGTPYALWTTPITLMPGMDAIFTETAHYNFDTSDQVSQSCGTAVGTVPAVNVTINGTAHTFDDTGLILTTGGQDIAACGTNEALGWRLIGTTGVDNPGNQLGTVPEPAAITLFGTGLVGLAGFLRRRRND